MSRPDNSSPSDVNGIETDFRAEVIAAELIENDVPAERILIVPLGAMHRPQRKDIEEIVEEISDYDQKEYTLIKTHKEGLYDKLPEGLFHSPISHSIDRTEQQVIESIKRHRREEKDARRFFLPFDAALYNVRVQVALYENQLDKKFHFNQLVNIFSPHWEIFQHLNVRQANIFLQFLPLIHIIRDDWEVIEVLLEQMFLIPAGIHLRTRKMQVSSGKNDALYSSLGNSALGIDMTTGHPADGVDNSEIVITFGPMSNAELNNFTGAPRQEKVSKMLCDYLLPADMDWVIEYDLLSSEKNMRFASAGEEGFNCDLGLSTYL